MTPAADGGVIPLVLAHPADDDRLDLGDVLNYLKAERWIMCSPVEDVPECGCLPFGGFAVLAAPKAALLCP